MISKRLNFFGTFFVLFTFRAIQNSLVMIFKIYMFISIISFSFSFSQTRENDTLECSGRLENAYRYRNIALREKKLIKSGKGLPCVHDELMEARKMSCQNAQLIEKKYPFILNEIKKITKYQPDYLDLNMLWINQKKEGKNDLNFKLSEKEETEFQKWKSEKNHSHFSVVIISNQIDDNNEYIQLKIIFQKEVINKRYQLSYNNTWSFKPI